MENMKARSWMRLQLRRDEINSIGKSPEALCSIENASLAHAEGLASLLVEAFAGTVDDEGETPEVALAEIHGTFAGKYGPIIWDASFVALASGLVVSASLVTETFGRPVLAFSMTLPEFQGQGIGGTLISRSAAALACRGERDFYLVVTDNNTRAQTLYRKLGFERVGRATPKSGVDSCFALESVGLEAEALVQEVFNSAPRYHFNTEGVEQVPDAARSALTALPPGAKVDQKFSFLLRVGERAVGFADLIRGFPDAETAYLGLLLIRESEQQKGWGREFYRKLEALAANDWGCMTLRLSILDSNPVQSFWEKLGFETTAFSKPHAGLRLESIKRVMVKRIT